jgi:hypothetical protein
MRGRWGASVVLLLLAFLGFNVPTAFASHGCGGAIYGIPTIASKDTSCSFARSVVYVWVKDGGTREEDVGSFKHRVYSSVTHRDYEVSYYLTHGAPAPVTAWANGRNSWVRFWYSN